MTSGDTCPVFLDSAAQGPLTRYSLLAFEPGAALMRDARGFVTARETGVVPGGFIDNLDAWLRRERTPRDPDKRLPFMGGWFVYLSYEVAEEVEPILRLPPSELPYSAFAVRVAHLAVHEHATRETFATVPQSAKDAAHALGATRWEMIRASVFPHSRSGLVAGILIGLGRALGETIAAALVIGASPHMTAKLFSSGYSLPSVIANDFGEATGDYRSALIGMGVIVFILTFLIGVVARLYLARADRRMRGEA